MIDGPDVVTRPPPPDFRPAPTHMRLNPSGVASAALHRHPHAPWVEYVGAVVQHVDVDIQSR
jgi:hypothetical protein